jgi:CheY-like chemotaxis protein
VSKEELSVLRLNHVHQLMQKGGINKVQLLGMVELMLSPHAEASISVQARDRRRTVAGTPVILVVEDNTDNMLTVKALLDDKYVVLEAGDGVTAVELARSRKPDLILMDIALPGVSGTDIMLELRSIPETSGIPIIAVSASAMSGDRERLLASGFDAYIPKPIESGILGSTIKSFLI